MAGAGEYQWTGRRRCVGGLIVLGGVVAVAIMVTRTIANLGPSPEEFRRALMAMEDHGRAESLAAFNLDDLRVPIEKIMHGGVPKDGIPALTRPPVVPVDEATFLRDASRVVGVTIGGQSRAYPVNVLIQHEAVNDKVGGVPIAVVYCPLCDSASVVERRLDGRTYAFGISGRLINSNVLLYDKTDEALWSQLGFTAISGPNAGRSLRHLPWEMSSYAQWREAHPVSSMVSYDTGHGRNYERRVYGDYFENDRLFFPVGPLDDRLSVKTKVVGVQAGGVTRAYPVKALAAAPGSRLSDRVGTLEVVLEGEAGTDRVRVVDPAPGVRVVHTYWFAWAAFHPETSIWGRASDTRSESE